MRGDRYEMQSAEQNSLMAQDIKYSIKVDTSIYSPEQCAEIITKELCR